MAAIPEVIEEKVNNLEVRFEEHQKRLNGNLDRLWESHEKLNLKIDSVVDEWAMRAANGFTSIQTAIISAVSAVFGSTVVGLIVYVVTNR